MQDSERAVLQAAVELLHRCRATFVRCERVSVTSGSVMIERDVAVFELRGDNITAPLAYAWTDPGPAESLNHRVILHQGVVKSPQHAVAGYFLAEPSVAADGPADRDDEIHRWFE